MCVCVCVCVCAVCAVCKKTPKTFVYINYSVCIDVCETKKQKTKKTKPNIKERERDLIVKNAEGWLK